MLGTPRRWGRATGDHARHAASVGRGHRRPFSARRVGGQGHPRPCSARRVGGAGARRETPQTRAAGRRSGSRTSEGFARTAKPSGLPERSRPTDAAACP